MAAVAALSIFGSTAVAATGAGELTTTVPVHASEHCGSFDGDVIYGPIILHRQAAILRIRGTVRNTCGRNGAARATSVWLAYKDCPWWCSHNRRVAVTHAGGTLTFHRAERPALNPGHITVQVCSWYRRRKCGSPVAVHG
jgi:hypothetical protein